MTVMKAFKYLRKFLAKRGYMIIPIKPDPQMIENICMKWDHSWGFSSGDSDEVILARRKKMGFKDEYTERERAIDRMLAREAYQEIVESTAYLGEK